MGFVVDDLLDFAQINNKKFRKEVKTFDLKEAINEVISIQKAKALMSGIKLTARYRPQSIGKDVETISFFNDDPDDKEQTSGELCNYQIKPSQE